MKKNKRNIQSRNCAASLDHCHRPSVIVCNMETKLELLE